MRAGRQRFRHAPGIRPGIKHTGHIGISRHFIFRITQSVKPHIMAKKPKKPISAEQAKKCSKVVMNYAAQQAAKKSKQGAAVAGRHIKSGAQKTGSWLKRLFGK